MKNKVPIMCTHCSYITSIKKNTITAYFQAFHIRIILLMNFNASSICAQHFALGIKFYSFQPFCKISHKPSGVERHVKHNGIVVWFLNFYQNMAKFHRNLNQNILNSAFIGWDRMPTDLITRSSIKLRLSWDRAPI